MPKQPEDLVLEDIELTEEEIEMAFFYYIDENEENRDD